MADSREAGRPVQAVVDRGCGIEIPDAGHANLTDISWDPLDATFRGVTPRKRPTGKPSTRTEHPEKAR